MTLDKIVAISGKPGLYELISAGKKNVIVHSLSDGKRFPVLAINNISALDSIAIFTLTEEIPLSTVLYTIYKKESGKKAISHKENAKVLTDYFSEILPDYDTDRVYTSNIKKIIQWYSILVDSKFDFTTLEPKKEHSKENQKDESGE